MEGLIWFSTASAWSAQYLLPPESVAAPAVEARGDATSRAGRIASRSELEASALSGALLSNREQVAQRDWRGLLHSIADANEIPASVLEVVKCTGSIRFLRRSLNDRSHDRHLEMV